jgi:sugar transferase (PEP-CTERM/EpsH1 system associated)
MQVVLSLQVGGLERVVIDLVNQASADFEFVVCCLDDAGPWATLVTAERGKVISLHREAGKFLSVIRNLVKVIKRENIQVVHTHNVTAHLFGAIAARLSGVRILHTEHGKTIGNERHHARLNRIAHLFTDYTVVVSQQLAKEVERAEGVKPSRLETITNGIRLEEFGCQMERHVLREELGLPSSARLIGSVGRLVKDKNFPLLLRAFSSIARQYDDVALVLVGGGHLLSDLQDEARRLNVNRRVHFLGTRGDIPKILGSLDVFVLSSTNEGLSVSLLEAMAAACPIVATAVGGNSTLIADGVNGLLVPSDDRTGLQLAITRLLDDPSWGQMLGKAAQISARESYGVSKMLRQYESLWQRLAFSKETSHQKADSHLHCHN